MRCLRNRTNSTILYLQRRFHNFLYVLALCITMENIKELTGCILIRDCFGILICAYPQPSYPHYHTCYLELRNNFVSHLSSGNVGWIFLHVDSCSFVIIFFSVKRKRKIPFRINLSRYINF